MFRLIVGLVVGWLAARWYYQPEIESSSRVMGRQTRSTEERARDVARETAAVAKQTVEEAKAAASIEKGNLEKKAERIKEAGQE
ncbi:MAG TPA: hypothetical protein VHS28_08820 [Chloroflexota bacterium]|nr:hypothetical protein [Chloroflexota bacterium]